MRIAKGARRIAVGIALAGVSGACAHRASPAPVVEVPRVMASASPFTGSIYRSGSRLKIRWIGTAGVRVPLAIVDTQLRTDCELHGDETLRCVPTAKYADDEKVAFLAADEKQPGLVVPDAECRTHPHTADDDHPWALSPMLSFSEAEPVAYEVARFTLDPATHVDSPWTMEGPGCVVHVVQGARGSLCVRPFRRVAFPELTLHEATLGPPSADGHEASGVLVAGSSDGAVLPLPNPEYLDRRNDVRCALDPDDAKCLPPPWTRLPGPPKVGDVVDASSHIWHDTSTWGNWADPKTGFVTWAKLTPLSPQSTSESRRVLALLDLGKIVAFPSRIEGSDRIALHVRVMPDGRSVPISLHDTELDRDCTPMKADDGIWRCVVPLSRKCQRSTVLENGVEKEVLTGSTSFCDHASDCCQGGPVWIPSHPGRGPRRFGLDAQSPVPARPERAIRFAEASRMADHISGWQPQVREAVLDKVEDLTPDVFARLETFEDH